MKLTVATCQFSVSFSRYNLRPNLYSPMCLEEAFCDLRLYGGLRSSVRRAEGAATWQMPLATLMSNQVYLGAAIYPTDRPHRENQSASGRAPITGTQR
jgi:hypothetical protein